MSMKDAPSPLRPRRSCECTQRRTMVRLINFKKASTVELKRMSPDKRYTCVHPACTIPGQSSPTYYSTWTSLQQHMRTAHPPTCPHPSCNGKTFSAQKGLRAHLRIHEQRDIEAGLREDDTDVGADNEDEPPPKKRRGGEVGRDFICEYEGCGKDFKSACSLP